MKENKENNLKNIEIFLKIHNYNHIQLMSKYFQQLIYFIEFLFIYMYLSKLEIHYEYNFNSHSFYLALYNEYLKKSCVIYTSIIRLH